MNAFRKANSFSGEPFDTSSESEVFALNALSISFSNKVRAVKQIFAIALITVSVITFYSERLQQFPELPENFILSPAKRESYDFTGIMVNSKPQPALVSLVANEAPHLVEFCFFHHKMRDYLHFYAFRVRVLV